MHMPDLVIYVINWTGMVHMNHLRGVCLVASIDVRLESTFVHCVYSDNRLCDTLIDRWTTLDLIGRDEGVEVMTLVGDALGVCPQPWLPGLSLCVQFMVITGLHVHAIGGCFAPFILCVSVHQQ